MWMDLHAALMKSDTPTRKAWFLVGKLLPLQMYKAKFNRTKRTFFQSFIASHSSTVQPEAFFIKLRLFFEQTV